MQHKETLLIAHMTQKRLFTSQLSFLLLLFVFAGSCHKNHVTADGPPFESFPFPKRVTPGVIDEASGIADSKANPGYIWVEQDSGNPNDIFLLSDSGQVFKKINIRSTINRDWEDIALAKGPVAGTNYLYIADIGDNNQVYGQYRIYRFPEPLASTDTVWSYDSIRFQYADGPHDAEAVLIDDYSNIYIITKQSTVSTIYRIGYPQSLTTLNTAVKVGELSFNDVVSAAISQAGDELLVKTYTSVYYWKKAANETIEMALHKQPALLNYQQEPQGEAICFKNNKAGFYTLGERPSFISSVNLNYYKRR